MESFDYQSQFDKVKKDAIASAKKALDVQAAGNQRRIVVNDVWVDDNKDPMDLESQKQAVRKDQTWGVPMYASVTLVDRKTGEELSSNKKVRVATIPKPTNLGSFIVEGKHYQVQSQLRRKPGVYMVQKKNKEIKTEVNIKSRPFDIEMDPKTQIFKVGKAGGGSKYNLYPVLSSLGISDSVLAKQWGQDVLDQNKKLGGKKSREHVLKVAKYFTGTDFDSVEDAATALKKFFEETDIRPEVTNATIKEKHEKVSPELLVTGSRELLKANRGERPPDDRHALDFKKVYAMGDVIGERLLQEDGQLAGPMSEFRKKIGYKLANRKAPPTEIDRLVRAEQFSPLFKNFFVQSTLANTTDQTNPITMINGTAKVTVMGEGGVADPMRVRSEERSVHPLQMGFIDPIHTPDSGNIGLVMNLPLGAGKKGNELMSRVLDARTKKMREISPSDARNLTMAFPDQYNSKTGKWVHEKVRSLVNGELRDVDPKDVDVIVANAKQTFSIASNSIPFLASAGGVRAQAATKMLEQAIPLSHREAPLVQVGLGKDTVESAVGEGFSVRSREDGVIKEVTDNKIVVKTKDGVVEQKLYKNVPLNKKSFLNAEATVKVGDKVKAGDVLADSNFTKDGRLALGTNLRAAYVPYKGYNFEDGIVITETAADKLTSEHLNEFAATADKDEKFGVKEYLARKPNGLTLKQKQKLDDDGVIMIGQQVEMGDPLWTGTRVNLYDPDYIAEKKLNPKTDPRRAYKEEWTKSTPGEVVDVVKNGKKVKVYVKTREKAAVGDKLTNRHGGKGIITKIIADGEAPMTRDGKPVEILLNPHGVVSRINPSQILETAAAKVAEMQGKPYVVNNFTGENYTQSVKDAVKKAGLKDTEMLIDPSTNKEIGEVLVGPQYTLKLSKQATDQFSARSEGAYDVDMAPAKGGPQGSKALDMLTFYSMLSHGARANIREMATYKANENKEFWRWVERGASTGQTTPAPQPTQAYRKFEAYMKGAGVNMERKGSTMTLGPLTDAQVAKMSNGEVRNPTFLRAKDLKQERGGFMDPTIFGSGKKWGHIELAEAIPNPVFEKPIKTLTGINDTQFKALVRGQRFIDPKTGEWNDEGGLTSGAAIAHLLKKIDVGKEIEEYTDLAKGTKSSAKLDKYNKRLKYLHALKNLGIKPENAYVQKKIPIVPTDYRKIVEMEGGGLSTAGLNGLYRDMGVISDQLKWQKDVDFMPESVKAELREDLYKSVKTVVGLDKGERVRTGIKDKVLSKGIIEQIKGEKAKEGFFQSKVLRRQQDIVGRGTIIPDPKLGVDQVGLPKEMAWTMFDKFVTRRLVNSGYEPLNAMKAIEERTPAAKDALRLEMESRPVMLNRAPSLHKFSIQSFMPQITDGKAVKIPPLVVGGFNADFDGDAMVIHVPVLDEAVEEAKRMLPSKNLFNPGTGDIMIQPMNEAALGIYQISKDPKKKGQILKLLPKNLAEKYKDTHLDKKGMRSLMKDLATESPGTHGEVIDKIKRMGDKHTYETGFTIGLDDLDPVIKGKDRIFRETKKILKTIDTDTDEGRAAASEIIDKADVALVAAMDKELRAQGNRFHTMVESGARGNKNQLKQIVSTPWKVSDHRGNTMLKPITKSFSHGLPFSDYWNTLYGARAVAADKQLQTQEPGAFNKVIMASAITNVISGDDCGTSRGRTLNLSTDLRDIQGRFLAKDVVVGGTVVAKSGSRVTEGVINLLRDRKQDDILVRSPLTCSQPEGTCSKCYGIGANGKRPPIGENVGAISGQALSEPLTQMTLRTFHSGGVGGRDVVEGYEKIDKLFKMPEIKRGKAALAPISGVIENIEKSPGDTGRNIFFQDLEKPVFVEKGVWDAKRARKGMKVTKGDILSQGLVQPQELLELKGMQAAQEYITEEVHGAYKAQGVNVRRQAIETVIRSATNTTKITDPGSSHFLPGDIAPWTVVQDFNAKSLGKKKIEEAMGLALKKAVPGVRKGTIIDDEVKKTLDRLGISEVEVGPRPIDDTPFIKGIGQVPLFRDDWMSQMGYQRLSDAIVEGAAKGQKTDLHGFSPIPAFAYGAEFGLGEGGKY
jgi:DNA-directed RNA polymerase subunit beta'